MSPTLCSISQVCDMLHDLPLYRAILLTAFFGFLSISNIAPHKTSNFDKSFHFKTGSHFCPTWSSPYYEIGQDYAGSQIT